MTLLNFSGAIPQRVVTVIMGLLAITVGYTMRACLSVAIIEMVIPSNSSEIESNALVCPVDPTSSVEEDHHTRIVRQKTVTI